MMKMSRISLKSNKSNRSVRSSHYEPDEPSVFSLMSSSGSKKEPKSDKKEVSKSNASSGHKGSIKRLNMSASKTAYGKSSQSSSCHMKFLFDPNGRFSDWIRFVVSLAFLYNFWVIIYRYSFNEIRPDYWAYWLCDYTCDFLYLLDIYLSFKTGFYEEGVLQTDPLRLRHYYMNTTRFYVDLLCLLPLEILYISIGYYSIFRIFRLAKIYKFQEWIDRTERHTNYPNVFRTLCMFHHMFAIFHYNTCFSFVISGSLSENFVYISSRHHDSGIVNATATASIPDSDPLLKYLQVFYNITKVMTMVGQFPHPTSKFDYVFCIIQLIFALLLFAIIMGNVSHIISNIENPRKKFQSNFAAVKNYMSLRGVPKHLQMRVIRWFDFQWTANKTSDELQVLSMLPHKLRAEISIHVHLDTLKRVEIFQNTEAGFLNELVLRLKPILYSPGDFICRKGEVGKEMYIVSKGKLQVISEDGKIVLATLKAGSYFGEISILNMGALGNRRTASVKSVGYSDLFCLSKEDLWEVLKEYPAVRVRLEAIAMKRLEKQKRPLSEQVNLARSSSLPNLNKANASAKDVKNKDAKDVKIVQLASEDSGKRNTLPMNINRHGEDLCNSKASPKRSQFKPKAQLLRKGQKSRATVVSTVDEREGFTVSPRMHSDVEEEEEEEEVELREEVEYLKRCVQYLEKENDMLGQQLERQVLAQTYDNEIESIVQIEVARDAMRGGHSHERRHDLI